MTIEDKLKELGYFVYVGQGVYGQAYKNVFQIIMLDEFSKIETAYIEIGGYRIRNQQDIDDIQIAFNRLKKDIQNLKQ